ncbi:MAG: Asp-tRNA(Asn)/Glu-tRNA(Gln) amidotransferase subunit GatA [Oenococcus sp.]|uniref:Glutamyl-tRNA(Gln) amidotransferase subunit A n=1 Tax=Oenococcus kitaharae DSM 17330 TaxID=1045004 RepID=G9WIT1_9LACO|nr:Asp-tRNA(Asn)/Glu-tRNA(Gln) amidotransferase subunit GatA [Oenococcus kitaharae]EHN58380.1 Aspartyl-tRNA(Asn) amidotransferase subunit A [Oenococcus kitaharae DSM 17330]MCV3296377.1 Asp-tRNA(Asn)/Glu-tRNA(Gln) amidotransferase subunit GatA [Oenococcus kitaharae]OEY81455.1 glutamyl-tRNA amidotransferase [Oenococcus kitaharae]OEY82943.1 glutamyl-tRNA amidotransferase [Oenococcus kitaharae]OEY84513.1 glutamyl-tRNA amidotransferase [Oenococcus kitaharae]
MTDFFQEDLVSLHKKLVNKEITAVDLAKAALDKAEHAQKDVNAYITLDRQGALKRAAEIDAAGIDADNIFSGIPLAVKDNIVTKGLRTTAASHILDNFVPIYDAAVMEKLNKLGLVVIGKTNMDEFAMGGSTETSFFGKTANAWDHTKVPGGSSGGSAAAVASGLIPFALGSDTGGSIRQPAAFNGIVGLKPTYGRVSRWGLIAFGSSLDQIGPLTRTVKDNARVLSVIAGKDPRDTTSEDSPVPDFLANIEGGVKGLRVGVPKEYFAKGIDDDVKATIKKAIAKFEELGAVVDEVSLPHSRYGIAAYYILASSEASSNLQRFDGIRYGYSARQEGQTLEDLYVKTRSEGFGPEVKRRIMLGTFALSAGFYDAYFKKAAQVRTLIVSDFTKVFQDHDLILGPTTTSTAFDLGSEDDDPVKMYMNDLLTIPVNLAGLPGMSINAGFANHLPVGLQIIGRPFDESTIYRAAYAFEQATKLYEQHPEVSF